MVRRVDVPLLTESAQMYIYYSCERAIGITLLQRDHIKYC